MPSNLFSLLLLLELRVAFVARAINIDNDLTSVQSDTNLFYDTRVSDINGAVGFIDIGDVSFHRKNHYL